MRTPVFDIGDTLLPSEKMINQKVREVVGDDVPEFEIMKYNIYRVEDVEKWLAHHGFDADPEKITRAYLDWERNFFQENQVLETLQRCNQFGPIGFISDNSVEAKEFYVELFEEFGLDYEGFVVSDEVGVEKPSKKIFQAFLDQRGEPGENFVYFGNNPGHDAGCTKVGMEFVWVDRYDDFGSTWDGKHVEKLSFENVKRMVA